MAGMARSLESMCTLKRGEAAAATHRHAFGSLFAVVLEILEWKFGVLQQASRQGLACSATGGHIVLYYGRLGSR